MANRYIILDGRRYLTTKRAFEPVQRKAQRVMVTLSGLTASQTFDFTDYNWNVPILTQIAPDDPLYGSKADLETAYAKDYVSFTDVFNDTYDVFMVGDLSLPPNFGLIDEAAHFEVVLNLRRRQV